MSYLTLAKLRDDTLEARDLARTLALRSSRDLGHSLVWTLFDDDPSAIRDFLYRESGPGKLLIVSERQPKGDESVWHLKCRSYVPELSVGQRVGFSLRANPTISLSQEKRTRSLVRDVLLHAKKQAGRPLSPEERQAVCLGWIMARAPRLGIQIDEKLSYVSTIQQLSVQRKNGKAAEFLAVDFEGVLTVEDPVSLSRALTSGVGRGRAYGLGLLLLRPLGG